MAACARSPKPTRDNPSGLRAGFIPYLQISGVIVSQVHTLVKYFFNFFVDFYSRTFYTFSSGGGKKLNVAFAALERSEKNWLLLFTVDLWSGGSSWEGEPIKHFREW